MNNQKQNPGQLQVGDGVPAGWHGHLSAYCRLCGVSGPTEKALVASLKSSAEPGYIEVNNKQRFVTADIAFRHLAKIAAEQVED
jgi:hypothetical protein